MSNLPVLTHDFILFNPPLKDQITDTPLAEFILEKVEKYGNTPALVHSLTQESVTFSQVFQESLFVAAGLKARGVKIGDVIAICSENRLEYGPVVLGILAVGATCAPLSPIYNSDELMHTMSISKPSIVFCSPATIDKIQDIKTYLSFIQELVLFGKPKIDSKVKYYEEIKKKEKFHFPKINPKEDVAFLFCSSGTTGLPKCVELTHVNYMNFLNFAWTLWGASSLTEKTVTLGLIPFFHAYGSGILLLSLMARIVNIVMPKFEEHNFLSTIQKYRISTLYVVPPLLVFLSKHPLVLKYDLSSVQKIICGAAPLSRETQLAVQRRLKLSSDIHQAYGMTELSVCCVATQGMVKTGSSGTIAPGMECKVVDLSTGKALPPYKKGELCFRGPFVMKGYRNNIKATKEAFDLEGWFHTGDIAYYDRDGYYLYIVDRIKELIKYKGFQVPPAELEAILLNHPDIKEVGVIGIPDENAGELPLAFVVKQPGAKITEEEIMKLVEGKVSPQKRLHGGVIFINEIPKNPSGKILRRELLALFKKSKL